MNLLTKRKDSQTYGCWGKGVVREFGMDMYTLLYSKWITNKDLPHSTGNSAQCYVAAWIGGEVWGRIGKKTQILLIFKAPTVWTSTAFHWFPRKSCDLGTGAMGKELGVTLKTVGQTPRKSKEDSGAV